MVGSLSHHLVQDWQAVSLLVRQRLKSNSGGQHNDSEIVILLFYFTTSRYSSKLQSGQRELYQLYYRTTLLQKITWVSSLHISRVYSVTRYHIDMKSPNKLEVVKPLHGASQDPEFLAKLASYQNLGKNAEKLLNRTGLEIRHKKYSNIYKST